MIVFSTILGVIFGLLLNYLGLSKVYEYILDITDPPPRVFVTSFLITLFNFAVSLSLVFIFAQVGLGIFEATIISIGAAGCFSAIYIFLFIKQDNGSRFTLKSCIISGLLLGGIWTTSILLGLAISMIPFLFKPGAFTY